MIRAAEVGDRSVRQVRAARRTREMGYR